MSTNFSNYTHTAASVVAATFYSTGSYFLFFYFYSISILFQYFMRFHASDTLLSFPFPIFPAEKMSTYLSKSGSNGLFWVIYNKIPPIIFCYQCVFLIEMPGLTGGYFNMITQLRICLYSCS